MNESNSVTNEEMSEILRALNFIEHAGSPPGWAYEIIKDYIDGLRIMRALSAAAICDLKEERDHLIQKCALLTAELAALKNASSEPEEVE